MGPAPASQEIVSTGVLNGEAVVDPGQAKQGQDDQEKAQEDLKSFHSVKKLGLFPMA